MQQPSSQPADSSRVLAGRVVVTASPDKLNQLEQQQDQVGQQLGLNLSATPRRVEETAPIVYTYKDSSWQAVEPVLNLSGLEMLVQAAQVSGSLAFNLFQQEIGSHELQARSFSFDASSTSSQEIAAQLHSLLNKPGNPLNQAGFDVTPDHLIKHLGTGGGQVPGGSPWRIPARTGIPDPATHTEPASMFKSQAAWEAIGANERGQFAGQGEGVTVAIFDTLPDLNRINHDLVDYVIAFPAVEEIAVDPNDLQPVNLKELYNLNRVQPPQVERPGGADIDVGVMEPYHGTLIASLVRELAPKAKIVLIEALNDGGVTSGSNLVEALEYVEFLRQKQAKVGDVRLIQDKVVLNLSLGLPRSLSEEVDALYLLEVCQRLAGAGVVIAAAAGNDSYYLHPRNPEEPAAYGYFNDNEETYRQLIAVSANALQPGQYALYSNQGNLAAPGMDLLMDTGDEDNAGGTRYVYWTGTSFATPLVAGSAAVLLSAGAAATDVKQILWDGATKPRSWGDVAELNLAQSLEILASHPANSDQPAQVAAQ